ncbi:MAG: hypothetical protein WC303_01335 [Candidatus Paceibacterota bacterium]|jgi:hypothetical protein
MNEILYTGNLKAFIESLNINEEKKNILISKIPDMDSDDRKALFKKLLMIYFLDLEDEEAGERIKKYCS